MDSKVKPVDLGVNLSKLSARFALSRLDCFASARPHLYTKLEQKSAILRLGLSILESNVVFPIWISEPVSLLRW